LAKLTEKRCKPRSRVLRELVAEGMARSGQEPRASEVASQQELIEILTQRARAGSVAACKLLLERPWEKAKAAPGPATDGFAALDELAVRRRA
jgi:hypothetical protein